MSESAFPMSAQTTAPFQPVLIVAGPTASGKSALALDLAEAFDGVVINADTLKVNSPETRALRKAQAAQ